MVLAIFVIFIFYIGWILAFLGFGSIILNLLFSKPKIPDYLTLLISGIFGMALVTVITTILNFFIPISLVISISIMALGLIFLIVYGQRILSKIDKYDIAIIFSLAIAFFIVIPMRSSEVYDTGLYHLASMKWIIESPVPLGLANLHSRFGFNCSWFVLSAVTEQLVFIFDYPYFILNTIIALFFLSAPVLLIKRIFMRYIQDIKFSGVFLLMAVIPVFVPGSDFISSTYPDFSVMVLILLAIYLIILYVESSFSDSQVFLILVIISAYALTIKLSALPLLFFALSLLIIKLFLHRENINGIFRKSSRTLLSVCIFLCIIVVVWILRGIAISGYLAYPSLIGYISWLPWSVPQDIAISDMGWVTGWARSPGANALQSLDNWDWVLPWFSRNLVYLGEAYIFAMLGIAIIVFSIISKKFPKDRIDYLKIIVPSALCTLGLLFWFLQAPDPRFGFGFIFSLPIMVLCLGLSLYMGKSKRTVNRKLLFAVIICLFIIYILINTILNNYSVLGIAINEDRWHIPEPSMNISKTYDGMSIYVPTNGDQVWNSALPNTPNFNSSLHMKISGSTGLPYIFWFDKT